MNRRKFIRKSTIAAGAALVGAKSYASNHKHHQHKGKTFVVSPTLSKKKRDEVYAAISKCIAKAEVCLSHCLEKTSQGDLSMMECLNSVQNMLPVCEGMRKVVGTNTISKKALKAVALACKAVCDECEKACNKHKDHHEECADCAKACAESSKALSDIV